MVAALVLILFKQALRQRLQRKKKRRGSRNLRIFPTGQDFDPLISRASFFQVRAPDFSVLFQLGFGHNRRRILGSKKVL